MIRLSILARRGKNRSNGICIFFLPGIQFTLRSVLSRNCAPTRDLERKDWLIVIVFLNYYILLLRFITDFGQ